MDFQVSSRKAMQTQRIIRKQWISSRSPRNMPTDKKTRRPYQTGTKQNMTSASVSLRRIPCATMKKKPSRKPTRMTSRRRKHSKPNKHTPNPQKLNMSRTVSRRQPGIIPRMQQRKDRNRPHHRTSQPLSRRPPRKPHIHPQRHPHRIKQKHTGNHTARMGRKP